MLSIVLNLFGEFSRQVLRRSIRRTMLTAVLMLLALLAWMVAAGFGLSLTYVWLQRIEGTMSALAIMSSGCVALGVILLLVTFLGRRQRRRRAEPQLSEAMAKADGLHVGRVLEEAIASIEGGSRESILAAAVLVLLTGIMLGRRL